MRWIWVFLICAVVLPAMAARVTWLDEETMPTFQKGLSTIREVLEDNEEDIQDSMWSYSDVWLTKQELHFDEKNLKVTVKIEAQARKEHNTNDNCGKLITKFRKTLFLNNPKRYLAKYFPNLEVEDLLYMVGFEGVVRSYAHDIGGGRYREIDPDDTPPEGTVVIRDIECSTALFSDEIFYY
ncbi:MAG: hypothetical protein H6908_01345 [Hyphomicrobiales bacterium]|nr:hypothetical protein [Rickettsiales bacterium]MCP5361278.1 hypothetical protein [Hyphomicrobiales bacterium]